MSSLLKPLIQLVLVACIGFGLGGCVTTRVPVATSSPWQVVDLNTDANPLDVAFTSADHGFLVGSNRLILETNDGGSSWNERSLDLPDEENFRLRQAVIESLGVMDDIATRRTLSEYYPRARNPKERRAIEASMQSVP